MPLNNFGGSSRGAVLGTAFVGVAEGSESILWNPAGLGRLKAVNLGIHHNSWLVDTFQESITLAFPMGQLGVFGLSAEYTGLGTFEDRDLTGKVLGESKAMAWGSSLAWGRSVHPSLDVGVRLRVDGQNLGDESLVAVSSDLGLLWQVPVYGLKVGAAASNLGTGLEDASQVATFKMGVARPIVFGRGFSLLLATGFNVEQFGTHRIYLASELVTFHNLSLRAGHNISIQDNNLGGMAGSSFGAGFKFSALQLDYTFLPMGLLGDSHRVSLSWQFAQAAAKNKVETRPVSRPVRPERPQPSVQRPRPNASAQVQALKKKIRSPETPPARAPKMVLPQKVQKGAETDPLDVYFKVKGGEKVDIEAEDDLVAITKNAPMSAPAWKALARFYYLTRQYDKVARCLKRVVEANPKDTRAQNWLRKYENSKK